MSDVSVNTRTHHFLVFFFLPLFWESGVDVFLEVPMSNLNCIQDTPFIVLLLKMYC